jgi:hypothetical protein
VVGRREAIRKRLLSGKDFIACDECDAKIVLLDMIEQKFGDDQFRQRVQELDKQAGINLDNDSLELILLGDVCSIAGEAGQIFRPLFISDKGIDGEIEFKDDIGNASGKRIVSARRPPSGWRLQLGPTCG